ncbi:hypothetical protein MJO28_016324 [Puccinia striiformis f. sp. tritici]|nr:hypothetical protein Pst134EA_030555 [Puccinia striiformis f. sp. tritici]KAI9604396.1 hypothetical protein KEM48_000517 [Puccinia striiformis f. sp. tritici PST-130]KNF04653.1 hypothetical protein PSTG_02138 [Puccinia striiformis f. sp. tritici PST-78]POW07148.1 hypothetical protein PSHT_10078 [Puccinia striiformis]KAH9440477.1 hypothetical protein Pst134EB_031089 [Puccinia striiformis f. sp. tritici]KAH9446644.1 hypothetical protein Pst134EA_030555 [Puccinia striiformis f. sp. tritici]
MGSQVTNNPLDNIQLSIPGTSQEGHSNEQDQPSTELQLETLRSEKATLEAQYGALLSKLTAMRTTLGDKLRQDADELDRREQQICQLQTQNEDLIQTTENLKNELISSNEETERLHRELGLIRTRLADQQRQSDSENYEREEAYRESQDEIEHLRNQLEDSQRELMNEAIKREQADSGSREKDDTIAELKREIEFLQDDRDSHARSASNLQSVLEEFQSAKESEIQSVVGDTQTRLIEAEQKLQVYEEKVKEAEAKLAASESGAALCETLKKELKEKNLLVGKVRHEAVILNEHLTEALRRLRKDSTEYSVDRRLVTNVLISFILTPREDTKRFEMLSLLSSILSWNEDEREQVGLQRASTSPQKPNRQQNGGGSSNIQSLGGGGRDTLGDNDTITDQWVSFLLRESNATSPTTPTKSLSNLSITSPSTISNPSRSPISHRISPDAVKLPSSPGSTLSTLSTLTRPTSES